MEGNGSVEIGGRTTLFDSQGDDGDDKSEVIADGLINDSFIFKSLQHLFLTPTDVLPGNNDAKAPQWDPNNL